MFEPRSLTLIMSAWIALYFFFRVAAAVGRNLGLIVAEEEIPFYPFRFLIQQ